MKVKIGKEAFEYVIDDRLIRKYIAPAAALDDAEWDDMVTKDETLYFMQDSSVRDWQISLLRVISALDGSSSSLGYMDWINPADNNLTDHLGMWPFLCYFLSKKHFESIEDPYFDTLLDMPVQHSEKQHVLDSVIHIMSFYKQDESKWWYFALRDYKRHLESEMANPHPLGRPPKAYGTFDVEAQDGPASKTSGRLMKMIGRFIVPVLGASGVILAILAWRSRFALRAIIK